MSLTAATWILLFGTLTILSLRRAIFGFSLYLLTFFASPDLWWWGKATLAGPRWNLYAGIILLSAVFLQCARSGLGDTRSLKRVGKYLLAILVNATFVHLALAPNISISAVHYFALTKFVLLFFLVGLAVRDRVDLKIALMSIVLGAGYIGFEASVNNRGSIHGSRIENIGAPGATESNLLASLMLTALPIVGSAIFVGEKRTKLAAILVAPLVLNLILLCNSRGAFLATIFAGLSFLVLARGRIRKHITIALILGSVATYFLLGDPDILSRFATTFVNAEERDRSAGNRLIFWSAGLKMVRDHPLGAGGDAYKRIYAERYLANEGIQEENRAVHNGFINEAAEWGIQGLSLRLLFILSSTIVALRLMSARLRVSDVSTSFLCAALVTSITGFLAASMFIDSLDSEWGYWIPALMVAIDRVARSEAPEAAATAGSAERDPSLSNAPKGTLAPKIAARLAHGLRRP